MARTLVVGDSLGVGTGRYLKGARTDAKVGRSSREGVRVLRQRLRTGNYDHIVFDVGTNDGSAAELAHSVAAAKRIAGGRPITMATVNGPDAQRKNRILRGAGVNLVDWAGQSRGLVGGDGIHASPKGYQQRARMLQHAIGTPTGSASLGGTVAKHRGKSKGRGKSRAGERFASQVSAESTLRFHPQSAQLKQAVQDLALERDQAIRSAEVSARGIQQMAKRSQPEIGKYFQEAQSDVSNVQAELGRTLGSTSLAPAAARDAAGSERRLAETLANARNENIGRMNEAEAGLALGRSNAEDRFQTGSSQIRQKLIDLGVEQGAFEQGRTGELREAAAQRGVQLAGQRSTSRTAAAGRRATARNQRASQRAQDRRQEDQQSFTAGEKAKDRAARGGKGGGKPATPKDIDRMRTYVSQAASSVKTAKGEGRARNDAANLVVSGRSKATVTNPRTGNKVPVPGIAKAKSQLAASIALDMEYDGHVSRRNAQNLRRLGITVKDLGLTSFSQWRQKAKSTPIARSGPH